MSKKTDRDEAIAHLRSILKPGDHVTCTVMHVSQSGMSRTIMLQIPRIDSEGNPYIADISWRVAEAIGERYDDKNGGVKVSGCGMNMCFAIVYNLGRVLFPDGFGIVGERNKLDRCGNVVRENKRAKSRHSASVMKRHGWAFRGRNGDASGWDNDGGYALDYRG